MPLDLPQPSTTKVPTYVGTQVTVTGADATGATNSASAFETASGAIVSANGGTLIVPAGTYQLGRQVAGLNGLYYDGVPSIKLHGCTNKVVIDVRGVTFKTTAGLKFGAFDPATGNPIDITSFDAGAYPHPAIYYAAQIGNMIEITSCAEVEIWGSGPAGTIFDGNINAINIGGLWHAAGDGGRALQHYGIWAHENNSYKYFNGGTHKHFCTDGHSVGYVGMNGAMPTRPHYIENMDTIEDGRLGFSWVGGNNMEMVWGQSLRNAMAAYTNGIQSVPSSGTDFENETSFDAQDANSLYNGLWIRYKFSDNFGCGVISASGQSRQRMTFNYSTMDAGRGQNSMIPAARYWVVNFCLLVGAFGGLLTQADMIANGGAGIAAEAFEANDSIFSTRASDSIAGLTHEWGDTGAVPGVNTFAVAPQINLAGYRPRFNRCAFYVNQWVLGPDDDPTKTATYTDCDFYGHQSGVPPRGVFNGTNRFFFPVPNDYGVSSLDFSHATVNGRIIVNGVTVISGPAGTGTPPALGVAGADAPPSAGAVAGAAAGVGAAAGAVTVTSGRALSGAARGAGAATGDATELVPAALGGRAAGRSFAAGAELLTGVGAGGAGFFPAVAAARLAGSVVRCDLLVFFDFATTPMRLWQGFGTLHTLDGHDWQGIGQLGQIGDLESAIGGSAPQTTFTLSGVDPGLIATTLDASDEVKGRAVDVSLQFFNDDFQPLDVPYVVWSGLMDVLRVRQSGPVQCTIELSAETIFAKRSFAPLGSLSDRDQQRLFPGDVGLSLVPQMVSKSTIWPVIPPQ